MGNVIHGASHKAIRFMREAPAALAVFWIYSSRTNYENVAWPALRGLARDTGWSVNTISKARAWLVEHGALEQVKDYVRPDWRKLEPAKQKQRVNLDKSEYYRPTGKIVIDDKEYPLLYIPQSEQSDIESIDDVSPRQTSPASDIVSDDTELDTSTTKHDTKTHSAPNGTDKPSPAKSDRVPADKMNPMKDAIATAFGYDWNTMTKDEIGIVQATAKQLCKVNATPEHVAIVYQYCQQNYTHFSPKALATKYSEAMKQHQQRATNGYIPPEQRTSPLDFIRWADGCEPEWAKDKGVE